MTNQYNVVKTSFWSFIQMLIMHLGAFVTTILLTRILSTEEYGVLAVANTIIMVSVAIFGFGLPGSAARYLAESGSVNDKVRIVLDVISLSLISTLVFILCSYLFLPLYVEYSNLSSLNELSIVLIFMFVFEHIRALCVKICNALGLMQIAAQQSFIISLSIILLTSLVLYFDPRVKSVLEMRALSLFISIAFIASIIFKIRKDVFRGLTAVRNVSRSNILRYGMPLTLTMLSSFLFIQTDILLISIYSDSSNIALYSISAFLLSRLLVVSFSIGMGLGPQYANINFSPLSSNNNSTLAKGVLYSFLIIIPIFIVINIVGDDVLAILFGHKYREASWILSSMGLYFLMQSVVAVVGPVLDYSGNAKKRAKATLAGGLVNVILSIYLVDYFGVKGVVFSTIVGYFIVFIVSVFEVSKITTVKIFINIKLISLLLVVFPLMFMVLWRLNGVFSDNLVGVVSELMIFLVIYLFIIFATNIINKDEIINYIKIRREF